MFLGNPSVRLLFIAQALFWSCAIIGITLTSIVGMTLAPSPVLATLPSALLAAGNLGTVHFLSMFMQSRGRRPGLILGAGLGVAGGLISAAGIWLDSFSIFCLGGPAIGGYQASAMYYRFAALEMVPEAQKGRAAALVVGGGVCAAVIAPTLAIWSRDAANVQFMGSYLLIAGLAFIGVILMARLREGVAPKPSETGLVVMKRLLSRRIVRTAMATTLAGHGIMVLVMTATPLAMKFSGLNTDNAAQVIQWHVLGMFLPAFLAGSLVDRFGSRNIALLGAVLLALSASVALTGETKAAFLASSLLLGMGWNLMFVSGTTLLASGHRAGERGHAQGLMELGNGFMATMASFAAGALISGVGWSAANMGMVPVLLMAVLLLLRLGARPQVYTTGAAGRKTE
ncbi:MFS transporter [Marinobacter fonticola]|uniref:MFS transporter n=1 Tax=Marinobacter fonticola TaxID=2603215 RepID=UPI001D0DA732|nr:MFS transporter [Marinobacter fonticola]